MRCVRNPFEHSNVTSTEIGAAIFFVSSILRISCITRHVTFFIKYHVRAGGNRACHFYSLYPHVRACVRVCVFTRDGDRSRPETRRSHAVCATGICQFNIAVAEDCELEALSKYNLNIRWQHHNDPSILSCLFPLYNWSQLICPIFLPIITWNN